MRLLQQVLEWGAGLLLCVMVAVGFLQVFGRYTGLVFVPWTEEAARLLFLWVVWLGAAAAMTRAGHIRFDFVVDRLPAWLRRPCEAAVHAGIGVFLIVLIWYGYEVAQSQATASYLTFPLSIKYAYLSTVVGPALMLFILAATSWARWNAPPGSEGSR